MEKEFTPLPAAFFARDCLEIAPELVGKYLAIDTADGIKRLQISEVECYRGEEDTACHARFGRTPRSEVLYMAPGTVYVYLCYGIHNLINIVTGEEGQPQAILIRACVGAEGPGKLTRQLGITRELNRSFIEGGCLRIETDGREYSHTLLKRVGIDYATEEYRDKLWRFKLTY